jgi:aspartate aminotransferase-like enzyme
LPVTGEGHADGYPVTAREYAEIEASLARLLGTSQDVVLLQGEAVLGLEAAARGIGGPGVKVLNIVTGPYGSLVGRWLRAGGAEVADLAAPPGTAISVGAVRAALQSDAGYDAVSVVHAEAATGVVNPLPQIGGLARAAGALVMVDAVASVGAEPLRIGEWGLDVTVIGPQKALGGPSGVSAAVLSPRAWDWLAANPAAPRESILSLLDWKRQWIDQGRGQLFVTPHHLETRALAAAIAQVAAEGLNATVLRHHQARNAARNGLRALGLELHVAADSQAAAVATLVEVPAGLDAGDLLSAAESLSAAAAVARPGRLILGPAPGPLAGRALRLSHTGAGASLAAVLTSVACLGQALHGAGHEADLGAALPAVVHAWSAGQGRD